MPPLAPRDARSDDYPTFARLFLALKVPDATPSAEKYDAQVRPHAFFLWDAGKPVAYAFWQPLGEMARVVHVVVDPSLHGQGVGAALMSEIARRARRAGCARWTLNVKPDNVPALRLYERFGMRAVERWWSMEIAWADVARLPGGDETDAPEAFLVAPEDEADVERVMALPAGQIATLRAGGGRVFVALRRQKETVAIAAFDPDFPGAMPFVAATPVLTRRLLEAMRPHAHAGATYVRFAAGSREVQEAAERAGAKTMLEVARMEGAVP